MIVTPRVSRRALLAAAGGSLAAPLAKPALAQGALKKVRIAVGTSVLNLTYPWLTLPVALGWWRDAGYDVEVLPVESKDADRPWAAVPVPLASNCLEGRTR